MKQRDEAIDVLKGMLVFGMILAHVSGLVSSSEVFPTKQIWLLTGLVTFSGFMFSFGYACQLAYFSKDLKTVYQRMLSTALKPLIAFYISGIYWRAFVDKNLSFSTIINILLLNDIPPFSEFLVAFALIILVSLLFFAPIQKVTDNEAAFWLVFVLLLLTTLMPYSAINVSQIGLLVGTTRFPTYPILQYLPLYLLGIYFAKHRVWLSRQTLVLSTIGFTSFILYYLNRHQLPDRFPPSTLWITASIFLVYLYYLAAKRLAKWQAIVPVLSGWGRNVLFYLLLSNIIIFTFRGAYKPVNLTPLESIAVTFLMLLSINFLSSIIAPKQIVAAKQVVISEQIIPEQIAVPEQINAESIAAANQFVVSPPRQSGINHS